MKITRSFMAAVAITVAITFAGCAPKDGDIKTAIETKLKAKPDMTGTTVDVKDGVATIAGDCKDDACKAECEKMTQDVKGVKSVINNLTTAAPPIASTQAPASLTTVLDEATQQKVNDGLKDIPGVTVEFSGDKAVISGEVTKANRMKIMQILASAKVKSDVSKLTNKK